MAAGNAPQVFPREYETDVAEIRTYDDDAGVFSARFFTHVRTYIRRKCAVRLGWNPELQALAAVQCGQILGRVESTPSPQHCASPRPQSKLFSTATRRLCSTSICAAASTQGLNGGRPQRSLFSTAPRRLFSTSICAADLHQGLNGGVHERAPYPTNTTRVDVHLLTPPKVDLIPTDPAVPPTIAVSDARC